MNIADVALTISGGAVAAGLGWGGAVTQARMERRARRQTLIEQLRAELAQIAPQPQPYNVAKVIYHDPIRLASLRPLRDGTVLSYRRDRELIGALTSLGAALSTYNDIATTPNAAQTGAIPDSGHRQLYDSVVMKRQLVIGAAVRVDALLGDALR